MSDSNENMSFLGHLEELRWRLVKAVIAVVIVGTAVFLLREEIINTIFLRLKDADFPTFKFACDTFGICFDEVAIEYFNPSLAGQFGTSIKMGVIGGFIGAFPFIFYQLWSFIKPGLKKTEVKSFRGVTIFVTILFFIGVLFGYYVIAPLAVNFLGNFRISEAIENKLIIGDYISTILSTIILTGVIFLLPVFIQIFAKIGVITSAFLKKYRKHSIVAVLILAAVITPPDIFTQIIVTIPIMLLYEFGIMIAKRIEKKRRAEELKQ